MSVTQAPIPVRVEGRQRLVYEVHLSNFGQSEWALSELRAIDAVTGASVAVWSGGELAARTQVIGRAAAPTASVKPGERAVVYLEFEATQALPKRLRHQLSFAALDAAAGKSAVSASATQTVVGAELDVGAAASLQLAPPLRGGPWVAIYAPQWPRGHRRVFYTLNGRARLPGRHAIDWVRVDADGRIAKGDADIAANSLGYGAEVLAVADARVAAVRDGQPESVKISDNPRHDFDQAAGNYVVLALADGRYATYEHLRPGSIKVREGDAVRVGQTIGALGFTGDSTGPHLHFHLADGRTPLASEGVPYGFAGFRLLGHYPQLDRLGSKPWQALSGEVAAERVDELPGSNSVVQFPR
ncbi:MAG: M23 family metallopeptidase [Lysobacter sp.]|nr:M23 family metallopeptidase [Lysobacter sp.]